MHTDSKINVHIDIFGNNPIFDEWWKRIGARSRLSAIVFITWIPLVVLSAIQGYALGGPRNEAMLWDLAVHMRLLIALPLLLMSSLKSGNKFRPVFHQFIDAEILDPSEHQKFCAELKETMRLRDSLFAKGILLMLVGLVLAAYIYLTYNVNVNSWRMIDGQTTLAGWWYNFVSQPILAFTLIYFLYRAGLWCRLLFKISQMKLNIKAYHGDQAGGLGFLGHSLEIFIVPVFAIAVSFAGGMMNLVLHSELDLAGMKLTLMALVGLLLIFFVGPLLFFFPVLKEAKAHGILEYGILSGKQLAAFKQKWLQDQDPESADILKDEDFQSLDSNNAVMETVHKMHFVPVSLKDIVPLLIAMLLPFLPVVALKVPWSVILGQITKIVM